MLGLAASAPIRVDVPGSAERSAGKGRSRAHPDCHRLHLDFIRHSLRASRLCRLRGSLGMSHLVVHGGVPLRGSVSPSANKNAVLPILCATLLTRDPVTLHRVPDILDVRKLL